MKKIPNISDKGLQELEELRKQLDEMNEKNKIPETQLYCLNCGMLICSRYTGQLWSYTHSCDYEKNKTRENLCTWATTTESPLLSASFIALNQARKPDCGCKDIEEHIEHTLEYYLGKHYKDYTPSDPKIAEIKQEVIKFIRMKIEKDSV